MNVRMYELNETGMNETDSDDSYWQTNKNISKFIWFSHELCVMCTAVQKQMYSIWLTQFFYHLNFGQAKIESRKTKHYYRVLIEKFDIQVWS